MRKNSEGRETGPEIQWDKEHGLRDTNREARVEENDRLDEELGQGD